MDGYLGEIRMFAGNFAPMNWAYCEGQTLAIADYTALFAIIGTYYGGDGRTSFALPDFRSRVPVGVGMGPGLMPYALAQRGGAESVILSHTQLPAHTHPVQATAASTLSGDVEVKIPVSTEDAEGKVPTNQFLAKSSASAYMDEKTTGSYLGAPEVTSTLDVTTNVNVEIGQAGASQPLYNVQPYIGMHYIICVEGLFPQRP